MKAQFFSGDEIRSMLQALLTQLAETGESSAIYLVGGSAISIGYFERRLTTDIDALIQPAGLVLKVASELAKANGWPPNWLNDEAKIFIPFVHDQKDWVLFDEVAGAKVYVASAELLLAMKLDASRIQRDGDDIEGLLRHLGISRIEDAEAIYERFNPGDSVPERGMKILRSMVGEQLN